jgi:hypothetical protein
MHPFAKHAEHKKSHSRVSRILQEAPAEAGRHADGGGFSRIMSKSAAVSDNDADDMPAPGRKTVGRFARGGRAIGGDASPENLAKWSARASANSYARGGALPTAGAMTGVGRLQKAGK